MSQPRRRAFFGTIGCGRRKSAEDVGLEANSVFPSYAHRVSRLDYRVRGTIIIRAVVLCLLGSVTVELRGNGSIVEDSAAVVDVLEAGLLAWANDWAATVLPTEKVTIDEAATT